MIDWRRALKDWRTLNLLGWKKVWLLALLCRLCLPLRIRWGIWLAALIFFGCKLLSVEWASLTWFLFFVASNGYIWCLTDNIFMGSSSSQLNYFLTRALNPNVSPNCLNFLEVAEVGASLINGKVLFYCWMMVYAILSYLPLGGRIHRHWGNVDVDVGIWHASLGKNVNGPLV